MAEPASFHPEQLLTHVEWVRRLAATLVADRDDADDVAQQTLLLAIERPPPHARNLRQWLSVAARNVARSLGRATTRRRQREGRSDLSRSIEPAAALVERAELHRVVVGATLALADPYRTTVLYRYFEGLETGAIAARCGVPVETVRTRLKRGLAQLRARLAHELRDGPRSWRQALASLAIGPPPLAEAAAAAASPWTTGGGGILMTQGLKLSAAAATLAAAAFVAIVVWRGEPRESPLRTPPPSEEAATVSRPDAAAPARDAEPVRSSEPRSPEADAAAARPDGATAGAADPGVADVPARIVGDVRDEFDRPVAGAIVLLAASESSADPSLAGLLRHGQFLRGRAPTPVPGQASAKTDELGRFAFEGVSTFSSYGLLAQHPQIGVAFRGDLVPRPGELLEVRLVLPAGVALVGSVLRSDGPSSDDIELHVWAFPDDAPLEAGKGAVLGKLDASEDGTFRTIALPYRRFELSAEVDRHRSDLAEARSGIVEAAAGARELRIDLTLPEALRIRGRIRVDGGTTEDLERLAAAERARWQPDEADGGDRIYFGGARSGQIRAVASDRPLRGEGARRGSARTIRGDADLAAGSYEILLSEAGMTSVALVLDDLVLAEAPLEVQGELGPDLVADLAGLPALEPTIRVELRVVDSADGRSVGDVTVTVAAAEDAEPRSPDRVHVPSSGRTVATLPAGRRMIVGSREGFLSERLLADLAPNKEALTLRMSKLGGVLRGEAHDEHGEPLARASLAVYRLDRERAVRLDVGRIARADGRFEGLPVPTGRFAVVASVEGRAPAWRVLDEDEAREPVLLGSAPSFRVRLVATSPTGRSLGRIRWWAFSPEGVPLLELETSDGSGETGREGAAAGFADVHLPAGNLTIEAEARDGARAKQELTLGRDAEVRLSFAPPAR